MSTIENKIRAWRLAQLITSLGWNGANAYLAKLTPEEKKDYFAPAKKKGHDHG